MKTLIVFDTELEKNIGCVLASRGLKLFFNNFSSVEPSITSIDIFSIQQNIEHNWVGKILKIAVPFKEKITKQLILRYIPKKLSQQIHDADVIVINGEGAIHHDKLSGIILLTLGVYAKSIGKKVILVNATLEKLSPYYLKLLSAFDVIITREIVSYGYVESIGRDIKCIHTLDFAWFYLLKKYKKHMLVHKPNNTGNVLVTKGVRQQTLKKPKKATYLIVDNADTKIAAEYKRKIDISQKHNIDNIFEQFSKFDRLLSGRHHITIMGLFYGIPISVIPSNTHKIKSTVLSLKELDLKTKHMLINFDDIQFVTQEHLNQVEKDFLHIQKILKLSFTLL